MLGVELEPGYRVLAVTVEPDLLRAPGTVGDLQLLCFPVSVLLVAVTRPVIEEGRERTAIVTFDLDQLTTVSERFAGAFIEESPFGRPEPRPGSWGPRYSLEGRTSASDGTRRTLHLDLATDDGARLRLFARFNDAELRDAGRNRVLGTGEPAPGLPGTAPSTTLENPAATPRDPEDPLRF